MQTSTITLLEPRVNETSAPTLSESVSCEIDIYKKTYNFSFQSVTRMMIRRKVGHSQRREEEF